MSRYICYLQGFTQWSNTTSFCGISLFRTLKCTHITHNSLGFVSNLQLYLLDVSGVVSLKYLAGKGLVGSFKVFIFYQTNKMTPGAHRKTTYLLGKFTTTRIVSDDSHPFSQLCNLFLKCLPQIRTVLVQGRPIILLIQSWTNGVKNFGLSLTFLPKILSFNYSAMRHSKDTQQRHPNSDNTEFLSVLNFLTLLVNICDVQL